jgi:hypothetical protein
MFHRDPLLRRGRVTGRSSLAVLLGEHPWIEDRLRPRGTRYLERTRSVPDELTLGSFARSEGVEAATLVSEINTWLAAGPAAGCNSLLATREAPQLEVAAPGYEWSLNNSGS